MKHAGDVMLAGTLTSSPMWVPILSNINIVLTTITLLIGVSLGVRRLWTLARERWPITALATWFKHGEESPPEGGPYF